MPTERDNLLPSRTFLPLTNQGLWIRSGVGSPEGVEFAAFGSLFINETNGDRYRKTTSILSNTGWTLDSGGGGGGGTVTSVALSMPGIFSVAGSPITGAGTFTVTLANQNPNVVWAGPASGAPAAPTFRQLGITELLPTGIPNNAVVYSTGSLLAGDPDHLWDTASGTLLIGLAGSRVGKFDIRGAVSGSIRLTVDQPAATPVQYQFGNSVPSTGDLWRAASVTGNNITLGFVAPSALGFANVNPTSGVLPYNNAGSFADSPISRVGANQITIGNSGAFAGLNLTGNAAGSGLLLSVLSSGASEGLILQGKGAGFIQLVPNSAVTVPNLFISSIDSGFAHGISTAVVFTTANGILALKGSAGIKTLNYYVKQDGVISWTDNTLTNGISSSPDIGLARLAAGVLRVANGGTGAGQFVVGSSVASTSHQFLVDSQATGRIAGYFTVQGGATQPVLKGERSAIQVFSITETGKIIGGCNIPTSNQQWSAIGNLRSDVSSIGNVGTGEDDLLSSNIGANVLVNTGDYYEGDAFGEFDNVAETQRLRVRMIGSANTVIFDTGAVVNTGVLVAWRINVKIIRTGASAQKVIVSFTSNNQTLFPNTITYTTAALDLTASITVQFTGEATTNTSVSQEHLEGKLCVALAS